jgi:hypothetical protein
VALGYRAQYQPQHNRVVARQSFGGGRREPMLASDYKHYTEAARRGIKGEAFFESLVVDCAIPHRIARQNDLGVDFLCEWTHGDRPTGILFAAQVKAATTATVKASQVGTSQLNVLEEYTLARAVRADERTINYWKGLGLPSYLFYVIEQLDGHLDCYYKRYTPILDGHPDSIDETGSERFYKVNDGQRFCAFADRENEVGGFARDLIIDYVRLSYSKEQIVQLIPSHLGFWPFQDKKNPDSVRCFGEIVGWHREKIRAMCKWTSDILTQLPAE